MKFSKTALLLSLVAASATALAQNPYVRRGEYYVGIASNTPQCPAIRYCFAASRRIRLAMCGSPMPAA